MAVQLKNRLKNGPVDPERATGKVREVFDDILRVRGVVDKDKGIASGINILWTTYGHSPTTLERNWYCNEKVMRSGNVPYNMKQSIAIVVATAWGCDG